MSHEYNVQGLADALIESVNGVRVHRSLSQEQKGGKHDKEQQEQTKAHVFKAIKFLERKFDKFKS